MRIESKKELIKDLNIELERLNNIKRELIQNKENLKNEYNSLEQQNKNFFSNESNILYYNNQLNKKSGLNINKNYKKRNFSAAKAKTKNDIEKNILKSLKNENNYLENILINYNHELDNIIQLVNDMELKCKLLTFNTNEQISLYNKQNK